MLDVIRKNTKVIIWSVIAVFLLWGGFSLGTSVQKQGRIAGEVFGKSVSFQEFNRFFRSAQLFSSSDKIVNDPEALRKFTWQSIIYAREAKKQGLKVSDDEVRRELLSLLAAQKVENPTPERYRMWLAATIHETPEEFEEQIREFLLVQRLIAQVNSEPVDQVTEADAKKMFLYEERRMAAEAAIFKTREEAQAFRDKLKKSDDWKTLTSKPSFELQKTDLLGLGTWIRTWGIPEETVFRFFSQGKGSFSEPLPILEKFTVLYMTDKQDADETKFDAAAKEKYMTEIKEKIRFARFAAWSQSVSARAGLKDFMPAAAPEPPAPTAN